MVWWFFACAAPPDATQTFSDAAVAALIAFDDDDSSTIAAAFAQLEAQIESELDLSSASVLDRSLSPVDLTEADVDNLEHPDRDPALALPVALAFDSDFSCAAHDALALLADHTETEPNSPEKYDRTFQSGLDCYPDSCEFLRAKNDLIKQNPLMVVPMVVMKDWRAFEMADGRAARASRGWMLDPADDVDGRATVQQSFAIELWVDQDQGSLRLLVLWAETTFPNSEFDDAAVSSTTALGMNDLYTRHDEWLAAQ